MAETIFAIVACDRIAHGWRMRLRNRTYLKVRRWVDRTIAAPGMASLALGPACLFVFPFVMLEQLTRGAAPDALLLCAMLPMIGWMVFVGWRGARMAKAGILERDPLVLNRFGIHDGLML